jgi:hypothetical protein
MIVASAITLPWSKHSKGCFPGGWISSPSAASARTSGRSSKPTPSLCEKRSAVSCAHRRQHCRYRELRCARTRGLHGPATRTKPRRGRVMVIHQEEHCVPGAMSSLQFADTSWMGIGRMLSLVDDWAAARSGLSWTQGPKGRKGRKPPVTLAMLAERLGERRPLPRRRCAGHPRSVRAVSMSHLRGPLHPSAKIFSRLMVRKKSGSPRALRTPQSARR